MAKVHRIATRDMLEEAAGLWIARLEADDVSEDDRQRFSAWLDEDRRHRETFEAMRRTWHRLDALGTRAADVRPVVEPSKPKRVSWAAAAGVLLAVGAASLWQLQRPAIVEYQTAIGQQLSVSLEDGSTIDLNTNTLIEVNYTDAGRAVHLKRGEAHFTVEKDALRAFVVVAGNGAVRAVGTEFNVYLTESHAVEVTVSEGIVEVTKTGASAVGYSQNGSMLVSEGQRIQYDQQIGAIAEIPLKQVERSLAWRQGMLSFDGETLEEVVAEAGRYSSITFVIVDPSLRELQVGGYFKSTDSEALADLLHSAFDVDARQDGERIFLTRSDR